MARQLGSGLLRHGFAVRLGSRQPAKLAEWSSGAGPSASVGSFAEAAAHGDPVILATRGSAVLEAISLAGLPSFAGKVVIDATNPLDFSRGMPPGLFVGTTDSLGEQVQRHLPQARVVKCFNTVGNARMIDPQFSGGSPPMMICGDDAGAKAAVTSLLHEVGWKNVLDVGSIDGARWLEALVPLWVRVGQSLGGFDHAFAPVR